MPNRFFGAANYHIYREVSPRMAETGRMFHSPLPVLPRSSAKEYEKPKRSGPPGTIKEEKECCLVGGYVYPLSRPAGQTLCASGSFPLSVELPSQALRTSRSDSNSKKGETKMKKLVFSLFAVALLAVIGLTAPVAVRSADQDQDVNPLRRIIGANDEGFITGDVVPGATARLQRSADGLKVNIHTSDLPAGAYTIWWAVYNYPENCTGPCGFDDDFNPAVGSFWVNATGKVISNGDHANFAAHLDADGPFGEIIVDGPGIVNPLGAEVQFVVRYHGPAIPGLIEEQTSTFLGGCPDGGFPCEDLQFVVFKP
jgi:hypothetical protein